MLPGLIGNVGFSVCAPEQAHVDDGELASHRTQRQNPYRPLAPCWPLALFPPALLRPTVRFDWCRLLVPPLAELALVERVLASASCGLRLHRCPFRYLAAPTWAGTTRQLSNGEVDSAKAVRDWSRSELGPALRADFSVIGRSTLFAVTADADSRFKAGFEWDGEMNNKDHSSRST